MLALDASLIAYGFVLLEPHEDIVWIVRVFACGTDILLFPYIVFGVAVEKMSGPFFANCGRWSSGISMASSKNEI